MIPVKDHIVEFLLLPFSELAHDHIAIFILVPLLFKNLLQISCSDRAVQYCCLLKHHLYRSFLRLFFLHGLVSQASSRLDRRLQPPLRSIVKHALLQLCQGILHFAFQRWHSLALFEAIVHLIEDALVRILRETVSTSVTLRVELV